MNLNLEVQQNRITGSRIFPIGQSGEASRWRVCYQQGLPRLVSYQREKQIIRAKYPQMR